MAAPFLTRFAEIAWHDADAANLVRIGDFDFHRWMRGGGYFLACGSMESHYFAGVTGGHKTLTVGVMSRASIERNHAGAMSPEVAPLKLDGNPVHEGVVDAVKALERDGAHLLTLNQVIVGGRTIAATAGHPLQHSTTASSRASLLRPSRGWSARRDRRACRCSARS